VTSQIGSRVEYSIPSDVCLTSESDIWVSVNVFGKRCSLHYISTRNSVLARNSTISICAKQATVSQIIKQSDLRDVYSWCSVCSRSSDILACMESQQFVVRHARKARLATAPWARPWPDFRGNSRAPNPKPNLALGLSLTLACMRAPCATVQSIFVPGVADQNDVFFSHKHRRRLKHLPTYFYKWLDEGAPWVEEQQTRNWPIYCILTITIALTKTTNCICRGKMWKARQKFSGAKTRDVCPPHFQICSDATAHRQIRLPARIYNTWI